MWTSARSAELPLTYLRAIGVIAPPVPAVADGPLEELLADCRRYVFIERRLGEHTVAWCYVRRRGCSSRGLRWWRSRRPRSSAGGQDRQRARRHRAERLPRDRPRSLRSRRALTPARRACWSAGSAAARSAPRARGLREDWRPRSRQRPGSATEAHQRSALRSRPVRSPEHARNSRAARAGGHGAGCNTCTSWGAARRPTIEPSVTGA